MYHFLEIHVNTCIAVKDLREIPFNLFYLTVEIWKHLKDTLALSLFLAC